MQGGLQQSALAAVEPAVDAFFTPPDDMPLVTEAPDCELPLSIRRVLSVPALYAAAPAHDADALREKAGADAKLEADAFIDQAAKADAQLVRKASGRLGDACARIVQEVRGL